MWRPSGLFHVNYKQEIALVQTPFQKVMWTIGVLVAFCLPFIIPLGFMDFFIRSWITITAVLGLTILTGRCGQISLGHTAFMAVGAFVGAVLLNTGIPLVLVLILTGLTGGVVGLIFGLPALRIKGFYLAFATLAAF